MTNRFFLFILFFTILSSCVSPKLFEETQKEKKELIDENQLLKKEKLLQETKYTELDGKNQILKSKINSLKKDSSKTSNEFRNLNGTYQELSDAYDLLLENNSQMLKSKGKEIKSLLLELQTAKNNLQTKEDELEILEVTLSSKQQKLLQTKKELEDRVQTVIKLESIISKKDSLLDALKKRVSSALLGFEGDGLTVTQKNGKVYVSLEEKLLFSSGSWQIDKRGQDALSKLSQALENQSGIDIMIEGHTDSIPFNGGGHIKDNWDLSVVRATSIVKILIESSNISENRLTAAGRGEFHPIESNLMESGRQANRRIEIILSPKLDELYNLIN